MIGPIFLFSGTPISYAIVGLLLALCGFKLGVLSFLFALLTEAIKYPIFPNIIVLTLSQIIEKLGMESGLFVDSVILGAILGSMIFSFYLAGKLISRKILLRVPRARRL